MSSKRVLVTGSSRGIGRRIALHLAKEGWSVATHYSKSRAECESLVEELGASASGMYKADMADPSQMASLFESALAEGEIHAVVNNAGVYTQQSFVSAGDDAFLADYQRLMAVNLESPVRMMRAATKHFATKGGGKIVNVASRVGFKGEAEASIYAASKAALINFTRSLAVELAPQKIGIFGIAPGWVDTAMVRDGMDERLSSIIATLPLGRMASPDDCASATAFLLSDGAAYLSGITIDINGASYFH